MIHFSRITMDPAVMGGKPVSVDFASRSARSWGSLPLGAAGLRFVSAYPYLEPEDIDQALAYAAWRVEEREVDLAVT